MQNSYMVPNSRLYDDVSALALAGYASRRTTVAGQRLGLGFVFWVWDRGGRRATPVKLSGHSGD